MTVMFKEVKIEVMEEDDQEELFTCNICNMFNQAEVPAEEVEAKAKEIIHSMEQKFQRPLTDRLFESVRNQLKDTMQNIKDLIDFEYFRAVLFDSIKEDFDWYVTEI